MRDIPFHLDSVRSKVAALRGAELHGGSGIRTESLPVRWQWWAKPNARTALSAVLVATAYYLGALIGFTVTFQSSPISPIWPPNAILLVALLLVPTQIWWMCLLAVFGTHMLVELSNGVPLAAATGLYVTNSSEAVLGAFLVRRFTDGLPWLSTFRRTAVYIACAVVVAPVVTSFVDAAVVVLTHWGKNYWLTWETRCVSNSMAELTIGPALLLGLTGTRGWIRDATRWRWIEAALLAVGVLLVGVTVFGGQIRWLGSDPVMVYAVLPLLLWAAVRFGTGGTSVALLGITVLATWGAVQGRGPFSMYAPVDEVISLQLYVIGISVPMLFLAALMEERQVALRALRTSEARYRDLVESQTDMICRYLPDSTLTFVNEAYCRYYRKAREQLIGTKFLDLLEKPARDHHRQYTAALLEHGHSSVDEHETTLPDGSIRWQQWVDHAIRDTNGNVVEIQSIGRDITDRKRTEEALHESETRFRAAFESAATGMMLVDTNGRALQVNRPLADILGYSEEELLTHTFMDLTYSDDVEANLALFRAGLAGEVDGYQMEKRLVHKDGHLIWTFLSAGVVRDAVGQARYFIGHVQDITERKQAEEALRASEERYRAVVNNFPRGTVLLFGQDLRHIFADGQGLPDIGLSHEAIVGKTLREAFPPDLAAALAPRYEAALAGAHAEFDLAFAGHTYQTQVLAIQYAGTLAGMTIMQDVTEQRRVEVLAELDRAKTAFFSNISHEFRTPLTLLLGPAADALTDHEAPLLPRQRERLELIQRGGLRLQKLVNTLLDFSRLEAGRVQAVYEPTDVATLTAELASVFRSATERAGLQLVVECTPLTGLLRPVYVDRDMWEQIVLNLLSNALKFTFEGSITVAVRVTGDQGDRVELVVSDTGTGIPAEDLPHLFERFYRVQGAKARTQEGTGIGLALVQELARLHGGRVQAVSALDVGSVFTVTIPVGDAHLPADRVVNQAPASEMFMRASSKANATLFAEDAVRWLPEPPPAQPPVGTEQAHIEGTSILVVDDNADMRTYLARLLSEHWDIQTVSDGSAALAAASARIPDLVLADVMMPGLDGFGLVAALRDNPQTHAVPIILLSARAGEEAAVEGLQTGADDYLIKPFSARELLARVQTHLELGRARREAAARAAQLDAIFEAITDGVLVHDLDGRRMYANRAYRDLLQRYLEMQRHHVEPDTLLAAPEQREHYITISDEQGRAIPLDEWPTERALRGEILTGANSVDEFSRGIDGDVLQVNVSAAPVRDASGQIAGAVAVFRDVTERRQLERRVAEQASQLEATFDAMTDGVIVLDAQGRAIRLNPAGRQIFGLTADGEVPLTAEGRAQALVLRDAEGQPLAREQLPTVRLLGGEVLAGATAQTLMLQSRNGEVRTISLTGAPLRETRSGQIIGAVGVFRDITELKRTQAALAEQERLFRTLVENSPDIITRFDRNLRHLYVSPASEAVTGVPARLRLGKTYAEIGLPEAVYGPWEDSLRMVFATGQPQVFETGYQADGGSPRVSQVRYVPEFAADGTVESVLGITSDITALKFTEEALRQSEERFAKAFHSSPVAMVILSRTTRRILDANAAQSRLTGYSRQELVGATMAELRLLMPTYSDARRGISRKEGDVVEVACRIRRRSGEIRSCLSSMAFLQVGGEECMIMTTRDVTARERAEEALRAATAAAEAAQREEQQRRQEAERREQIAESLREVLAILNSDRQVTKTLEYITRQAGRLLGSDAAGIYAADSNVAMDKASDAWTKPTSDTESGTLALQAAVGLPPVRPSSRRGTRRPTVGDAAIRQAMAAQRPVAVLAPSGKTEDNANVPWNGRPGRQTERGEGSGEASAEYLVMREEPLPAPYHALLAIPIVSQGQVYGGLLLLYTAPRHFSTDEIALAMAYGDQIALAMANARLQDHIERAAVETERNRLARELHDTVTQEIFTASVLAESIPQVWEKHRVEAEASLHQLHQLTRGALAALRALLLELRPAVLEQKGLPELLQQLGEAMTTRSGVPIMLTITDDCPPIPNGVKVAFYRIAQEALTNVAKYAQAHAISVRLRFPQGGEAIQLEVQDDGQGFEAGAVPIGHFGIGMMRERARAVGATLRIMSRPKQGTRVTVKWASGEHAVSAKQELAAAGRTKRGGRP